MAAVVLPLPGPVLIRINPWRDSAKGPPLERQILPAGWPRETRARHAPFRVPELEPVPWKLVPVVWVSRKDCKCTIELLAHDHACQFVRQRHRAERQQKTGARSLGVRPSVCRA